MAALRNILVGVDNGTSLFGCLYIPNAFITVLGFAGIIVAIEGSNACLLFWKMKASTLFFEELKRKWLIQFSNPHNHRCVCMRSCAICCRGGNGGATESAPLFFDD